MPLVTIWRDRSVTDEQIVTIRDYVHMSVINALKVKKEEVALRVRDLGPFDINNHAVSIEIDTGPGKQRFRIEQRRELAITIAFDLVSYTATSGYPWTEAWKGSSVWLRICESAFVPIDDPESAR